MHFCKNAFKKHLHLFLQFRTVIRDPVKRKTRMVLLVKKRAIKQAIIRSYNAFFSVGITLLFFICSLQHYNAHSVSSTIKYHMENDPFSFPRFWSQIQVHQQQQQQPQLLPTKNMKRMCDKLYLLKIMKFFNL